MTSLIKEDPNKKFYIQIIIAYTEGKYWKVLQEKLSGLDVDVNGLSKDQLKERIKIIRMFLDHIGDFVKFDTPPSINNLNRNSIMIKTTANGRTSIDGIPN